MNIAPLRFLALLIMAALTPPAAASQTCRASSGPLTRPLVELYTSEGCNSCPPADRWLAANFATPGGDAGPVALAFHVDYWDRLGWVDRFASAAYAERQYEAMRANKATFVYTPQVLLQGRDFPRWREGGVSSIETAGRQPARATLMLEATASGSAVAVQVNAEVTDAALRGDAQVLIAYADSGLSSDVRAGENRGVRLTHEHVVRALRPAGAVDGRGRVNASVDFVRPREPGTQPMVVAFVQRRSNGDVLQTLVLPIAACGGS